MDDGTASTTAWPGEEVSLKDMLDKLQELAKRFPPPCVTDMVMLSGTYNALLKATTPAPTGPLQRPGVFGGIRLWHEPTVESVERTVHQLRANKSRLKVGIVVEEGDAEMKALAQRLHCRRFRG